ncbi:Hypothetical protein NTJ_13882 [Nesidiocoris tenuis]|uniref:Lysosomal-associated transmembrane protein 4B n=1 Tax=Nesidiocoris tenuis TaxID=355587 RepID=A0ABN7B9J9_9HEMI|nr:Hypothetical protein NTJ_13882 [Nesidiocoris tenuis]
MPAIKKCFCCSLETGTKIIGYMQVIFGTILVIAVLIYMSMLVYLKNEVVILTKLNSEAMNATEADVDEEVASQKIAFAYVMLALIIILVYVLFSALMGALLLAGVYKRKLNYVKWWIRIKTSLILIATGWLLLQLLLLLYGMDANLTKSILSLVYDGCLVLVVNSYYDEESEKPSIEFLGGDGLPPPAYC